MPDFDMDIDRNELLRYLGYRGGDITPELMARIDKMSSLCVELSEPRYHYEIFPLTFKKDMPYINGIALTGGDISLHLKDAVSCAVMAVTLGLGTDREFRRLESRSMTDAIIFDSACTALVESAADKCEEEIKAKAAESGYYVNFRYSPGYGDFPIEQQKDILAVLNAERRLGITLTDSYLMLPRKSVSAVIGIFRAPQKSSWYA